MSAKRLAQSVALGLLFVTPMLSASTPQARQVFVYNNFYLRSTVDPALAHGMYERQVLTQVFEGLTGQNPRDLTPIPGVAARWVVSADGKTYTFYLNPDAQWNDGTPVTASDFVYAWKRVLDPKFDAPYANQLYYLRNGRQYHSGELKDFSKVGVRAVGDQMLEVQLETPTPFFLQLTSFYTLYPVPKNVVERNGKWTEANRLVSNGPFMIDSRSGDYWRLVPNPHYWDAKNVKLTEVRVYGIGDPEKAIDLYASGKLDYTGETPIPSKLLSKWRYTPDFKSVPWFAVNFFRLNTTRAPFNDARVRHAFSAAIDKATLTTYMIPGGHQPAYSIVPNGIPNYTPPRTEGYDKAQAQKLLSEAGYCVPNKSVAKCKPFPSVTLLTDRNQSDLKMVLAVQQMLSRELGIKSIHIKTIENWGDYLKAVDKMDFDIAKSRWTGDYFDPNTFLEMWTTGNQHNDTGWSDPEYDKMLATASNETSLKKRMATLEQAEKMLLDAMPVIPVFDYAKMYLMKPYVQGFSDNLRSVLYLKPVYIEYYPQKSPNGK